MPTTIDLNPPTCPRCGREAWFRYRNTEEAVRRSPICWGEIDQDCPGYRAYAAEMAAKEQR